MATRKAGSDPDNRRGKHRNPNSLANLNRVGSETIYDEPKTQHSISVTKTGWRSFQALAENVGLSASELVESLGRGKLDLTIKIRDLSSNEALAQLNLTPAQLMEMPLIEVLQRLSFSKEPD